MSIKPQTAFFLGMAAAGGIFGFGMLAGAGLPKAPPAVIDATGIRLVDAGGKLRGEWGVLDGKVGFRLLDDQSKARITMSVGSDPQFVIWGESKYPAIAMTQSKQDGTEICLSGEDKKPQVQIITSPRAVQASIYHFADQVGLNIQCEPAGHIGVLGYSKSGKRVWDYFVRDEGKPSPK